MIAQFLLSQNSSSLQPAKISHHFCLTIFDDSSCYFYSHKWLLNTISEHKGRDLSHVFFKIYFRSLLLLLYITCVFDNVTSRDPTITYCLGYFLDSDFHKNLSLQLWHKVWSNTSLRVCINAYIHGWILLIENNIVWSICRVTNKNLGLESEFQGKVFWNK